MSIPGGVSRIVVLSPNWLGDAVMALPALADIRRHFTNATLTVAARGRLAAVFESVPGIDDVVSLSATGTTGKRRRVDTEALRSGGFDLAILLPNSFFAAWMVWRARIPHRWGYGTDGRRWLLTRAVHRARGTTHQGEYYQHLVRQLGLPSGPLRPDVTVSERDRRNAMALLVDEGWDESSPIVALAPGAAYGLAKRWPPAYFGELAASLVSKSRYVLLDGVPEDRDTGREVVRAFEQSGASPSLSGRLINLIGRTDLHQLMGLLTHCTSFVGNDSGAGHLAAAVGLPVVMIFGPTDVRVGAPLSGPDFAGTHAALSHPVFCSPCWLRDCVIDHRCMRRIAPTRVLEAVMRQLEESGAVATGASRADARSDNV